jgi:hypothetical protein
LRVIGHHHVVDDDIDQCAIRLALFVDKIEAVAVVEHLMVFDPVTVGLDFQQFTDVLPLDLGLSQEPIFLWRWLTK